MIGVDEAGELKPGAATWELEADDLGAHTRDAADGVEELALDEHAVADLEAEGDEEVGGAVEVGDGDADMVESWQVGHDG